MASQLKIGRGMAIARRAVPRRLRAHSLAAVLVIGVLVGGGLRFIPADDATAAGSGEAGQEVAASTACAAQ
jgi:hypothetical protein